MTAEELFRRITGALDRAEIPYMVTGSFASAFHGVPRATQDIDLEGGWKIDLIVRKGRPFSRAEFDRRQTAEVWGLKEWARAGQGAGLTP